MTELGDVHSVIRRAGDRGATCADVLRARGGDRANTSRRIADLREAGLVVASGEKRPGPSGRRQIVWVVTDPERGRGRHR